MTLKFFDVVASFEPMGIFLTRPSSWQTLLHRSMRLRKKRKTVHIESAIRGALLASSHGERPVMPPW